MRVAMAKGVVDVLKNRDAQSAARAAIDELARLTGSTGGIILIDRRGDIGYARNTTHMPVCIIRTGEDVVVDR
jgi:beta-aspartyl-peptidase (threonine type)